MTERFQKKLKELVNDTIEMGELSIDMLDASIYALRHQDGERADWVISKKDEINEMDYRIEEEALQCITLFQPMARDMRTVGAILKMITYFARIGRYAKDIANISKEIKDQPHIAKLVSIPHESQIVCKMIRDALEAFKTWDISIIEDMEERDNEVDALRYSIFRECLTYMMEDQKNITRCMHYVMIARYLERCGDHACKIAEKVYYMVTGEHKEIS